MSCDDPANDIPVDIGESIISALILEDELGVVHSELMEQGGIEIEETHGIPDDIVGEFVGFAVGDAPAETAARDPA